MAPRHAARVVMLDASDAVLLLAGRDPGCAASSIFWFVPGGGCDPGETTEEAARREALEEVGAMLGALGPVVWHRRTRFEFDGVQYDQAEYFYLVRVERFAPCPTGLTALERRAVLEARWWPLAELATAAGEGTLTVYPPNLAELVRGWLAHAGRP